MSTRVVVGVDGSVESVEALRHAIDEALMRKASLDVISAYELLWEGDRPAPADWFDRMREDTEALLDEAMQHAAADPESRPEQVTLRAVEGDAGVVLVEAAKGAQLLVVGSRGRSAVARALLGSVSAYCLRHSPCPVLVVRTDHGPARTGGAVALAGSV